MVPVAAICSTLFLLVSSRFGGSEMFWADLGCLRSSGCILVLHVV